MNDSTLPIGVKLRHARKVKGLRLADLAKQVECSEGFLSKLENDKVKPSLQLLHRIVGVLGTSISALFIDNEQAVVARAGTRPVIQVSAFRPGEGVRLESLIPNSDGHLLYGAIHIVSPGGGSSGPITHEGEEVGFVLEGVLELKVDGEVYHLEQGDSFHFFSHLPHGYRNLGKVVTRILWVNTPPTF
ncbi:MAG: cupin domain-containing protein [Magnetovibrio sp.]|nr:cupin domain-containing protein [Magnetovibrio sp.]